MLTIALAFCLFVAFLGILGVASPARFMDLIRRLTSIQGFYVIAVSRIAFGAVLYLVAERSKEPLVVEVLGIVLVVSGIVTPFFGHEKYRKVVEWWSAGGDKYIRVWAGCTAVFAGVVAYVLIPASS